MARRRNRQNINKQARGVFSRVCACLARNKRGAHGNAARQRVRSRAARRRRRYAAYNLALPPLLPNRYSRYKTPRARTIIPLHRRASTTTPAAWHASTCAAFRLPYNLTLCCRLCLPRPLFRITRRATPQRAAVFAHLSRNQSGQATNGIKLSKISVSVCHQRNLDDEEILNTVAAASNHQRKISGERKEKAWRNISMA